MASATWKRCLERGNRYKALFIVIGAATCWGRIQSKLLQHNCGSRELHR